MCRLWIDQQAGRDREGRAFGCLRQACQTERTSDPHRPAQNTSGKIGHAGKLAPGFQVVHMMDCRNPNQIIVGEIESWRMQKFVLKGSK